MISFFVGLVVGIILIIVPLARKIGIFQNVFASAEVDIFLGTDIKKAAIRSIEMAKLCNEVRFTFNDIPVVVTSKSDCSEIVDWYKRERNILYGSFDKGDK